jgi:hypothetical protein
MCVCTSVPVAMFRIRNSSADFNKFGITRVDNTGFSDGLNFVSVQYNHCFKLCTTRTLPIVYENGSSYKQVITYMA